MQQEIYGYEHVRRVVERLTSRIDQVRSNYLVAFLSFLQLTNTLETKFLYTAAEHFKTRFELSLMQLRIGNFEHTEPDRFKRIALQHLTEVNVMYAVMKKHDVNCLFSSDTKFRNYSRKLAYDLYQQYGPLKPFMPEISSSYMLQLIHTEFYFNLHKAFTQNFKLVESQSGPGKIQALKMNDLSQAIGVVLDMVGCMPDIMNKPENLMFSPRYPTLKTPDDLVSLCDRLITEVNRRITEGTEEEYTALENYMLVKRVTIKPVRLDPDRPCINLFLQL